MVGGSSGNGDVAPCVLDVIATMGELFHVGAVADRPEVSHDAPPPGSGSHTTKPRPGWMVDAYLATKPGTAGAVNALATAIVGGNERKPPAAGKAKRRQRRQRKDPFGNGPRPADYTPDCPTPEEIRERCRAIRAEWTEEDHERRVIGQSVIKLDAVRKRAENIKPRSRRQKGALQVV